MQKVKEIAPEFYDSLPHHTSWVYVIYRYITDPNVGPFNRVRRSDKKRDDRASAPVKTGVSLASDSKTVDKVSIAEIEEKAKAE